MEPPVWMRSIVSDASVRVEEGEPDAKSVSTLKFKWFQDEITSFRFTLLAKTMEYLKNKMNELQWHSGLSWGLSLSGYDMQLRMSLSTARGLDQRGELQEDSWRF